MGISVTVGVREFSNQPHSQLSAQFHYKGLKTIFLVLPRFLEGGCIWPLVRLERGRQI